MEEDIKRLEEIIEDYKDCFVENYIEMVVDCRLNLRDIQAIENLIARNKELEFKKQVAEDTVKSLENDLFSVNKKEYILKSKVKEIIEKSTYPDFAIEKLLKLLED